MSDIHSFVIAFLLSASIAAVFWKYGFDTGQRKGIAVGWRQYRDEQVARDKARRELL